MSAPEAHLPGTPRPVVLAHGSLRLTLGKDNTDADADALLNVLPGIIEKLRALR